MSSRQNLSQRLTDDDVMALLAKFVPALAGAIDDEADALSIAKFCRRHGISLAMFYKLVNQELGPQTFFVGTRVLISREAAAAWRRQREKASDATQPASMPRVAPTLSPRTTRAESKTA